MRANIGEFQTPNDISKLRMIDQTKPYLLCLEDPGDSTNDLGRKAYGWKHIQETFRILFKSLKYHTSTEKEEESSSYLVTLIGTAELAYAPRRRIAQEYGDSVLNDLAGVQTTQDLKLNSLIKVKKFAGGPKKTKKRKVNDVTEPSQQDAGESQVASSEAQTQEPTEEKQDETSKRDTNKDVEQQTATI